MYLLGLDTLRHDPRKGIPFRLRTLLAASMEEHSTKANFWLTRHCTTGDAVGSQRLMRLMAPLRNWRRSISLVPGGVLPTNSSRLILSWATCCAARMEDRAVDTPPPPPAPPADDEDGGNDEDEDGIPCDDRPPIGRE